MSDCAAPTIDIDAIKPSSKTIFFIPVPLLTRFTRRLVRKLASRLFLFRARLDHVRDARGFGADLGNDQVRAALCAILGICDVITGDKRDGHAALGPPLDLFADRRKARVELPEIELELLLF